MIISATIQELAKMIAGAVIQSLVERHMFADTTWLRLSKDPVQRAYENAIAVSITEFKQEFPEWYDSFWDEHFFKVHGAGILAQFLHPLQEPSPDELVEKWLDYFPLNSRQRTHGAYEARPIANRLLSILDFHLQGQEALAPFFERRKTSKILSLLEKSFVDVEQFYIPVVVCAMNKFESIALQSGRVFKETKVNSDVKAQFKRLQSELRKLGIRDISNLYGNTREEWIGGTEKAISVFQRIQSAIGDINYIRKESDSRCIMIEPLFLSKGFFSDSECHSVWKKLHEYPSLIIIDALSLFHPGVKLKIDQSHIMAQSGKAWIVILPPQLSQMSTLNTHIHQFINSTMPHEMARFNKYLEIQCELGVTDEHTFKRWLKLALDHFSQSSLPTPNYTRLNTLEQQFKAPRVGSHIFGSEI